MDGGLAAGSALSFSSFRAMQATLAPAWPKAKAIALPMPRDAPVTRAVWPDRST